MGRKTGGNTPGVVIDAMAQGQGRYGFYPVTLAHFLALEKLGHPLAGEDAVAMTLLDVAVAIRVLRTAGEQVLDAVDDAGFEASVRAEAGTIPLGEMRGVSRAIVGCLGNAFAAAIPAGAAAIPLAGDPPAADPV